LTGNGVCYKFSARIKTTVRWMLVSPGHLDLEA